MYETLKTKAESYEPFTKKLLESNDTLLVEATLDIFLSAGTSEVHQHGSFMGSIQLVKLRKELR